MKNIVRWTGFVAMVLTAGWVGVSCNRIDADEMVTEGFKHYNPNPVYTDTVSERNVLIEDYMGVKCTNCPNGDRTIHEILENYGNRVVAVALSPMGRDASLTTPYPKDSIDLRTEEAATYADYFGLAQYPGGLINRKGGFVYDVNAWSGLVASVIDNEPNYLNLLLGAIYNTDSSMIYLEVKGIFVEDYDGNLSTTVMVLEDDLTTKQLDNGNVGNYVHNHVMRALGSPVWGNPIVGETQVGNEFRDSFAVKVSDGWKRANLSLVVFVADADTREVIQAAKIEMK